MRYKYSLNDKYYTIIDNINNNIICDGIIFKEDSKNICDLLNKYDKRIEYQKRVIDKCIKQDKKNSCIIEDNDFEINKLKNEKKIYKKIIHENMSQ